MRIPTVFALLVFAGSALAFTTVAPSPALAKRAFATPTPSPAPALPPEDAAVTRVGRQIFVTWQIGQINSKKYAPQLAALASSDQVAGTSQQLALLGSLNTLDWLGFRQLPGLVPGTKVYLYRANCVSGAVMIEFAIQPDGLISAIHFAQTADDLPDADGNTPEPKPTPTDTP